jgi:hypothetical protein
VGSSYDQGRKEMMGNIYYCFLVVFTVEHLGDSKVCDSDLLQHVFSHHHPIIIMCEEVVVCVCCV